MPNLQQPFELETYASGCALGVVHMQVVRPICCHLELFHGVVLKYPTYDKELYVIMQETIIHIDHSTPIVSVRSKQDATSDALQVVRILATIPPIDQVHERTYK
jgi:hypothetical protein